jgi:DNA-binding CsgD family transcriptional regulator
MRSTGRRVHLARRKLPFSITSREIEVLQWVARGKSAREIGEILQITKRTVDQHVQSTVRKMDAANRIHAVALAIREGIIEL